jgi:signal transduction histidine kinase
MLAHTRLGGRLITGATRRLVQRQTGQRVRQPGGDAPAAGASQVSETQAAYADLEPTLKALVTAVVDAMGYVGAMVATYESDDSLSVRAYYADPSVASEQQIRLWESQLSQASGIQLSLSDPEIARVYVHQAHFAQNLSVRAYTSEQPVKDTDLISLFRPVVPDDRPAIQRVVTGIQSGLGIKEVIAVPFFLPTAADADVKHELVGNLFVLSRNPIAARDEQMLIAFGQQAAAAILSDRRRMISEHQRLQLEAIQKLIFDVQASLQNEEQILQRIVRGMVEDMHYVAALVATYEPDDSLPVRAYYADPSMVSEQQIRLWESQLSQASGLPISLSNPEIARVYVHQAHFAQNLGVRAYMSKQPVKDTNLISLFRPVVPDDRPAIQRVVTGIQNGLGIKEVIAVPFFIETEVAGKVEAELVGNLFALTTAPSFSTLEVQSLRAFGQQAAAGLKNARLYHQVEEQRRIAEEQRRIAEERRQLAEGRRRTSEVFAKMAFNAATLAHDLTNHIGMIRMPFNSIIKSLYKIEQFPQDQLQEIERKKGIVQDRLDKATIILKNLNEPWSVPLDAPTNINICLANAIQKLGLTEEPWIDLSLAELPVIQTSSAMLSEAFRVIIKNAVEAIEEKGTARGLWIQSNVKDAHYIEVTIRDNGIGIKPENSGKIFEMGWSTKKVGLGFGLFWAKDYIEEGLKGKLLVESEQQKGTIFRINIPCTNYTDS